MKSRIGRTCWLFIGCFLVGHDEADALDEVHAAVWMGEPNLGGVDGDAPAFRGVEGLRVVHPVVPDRNVVDEPHALDGERHRLTIRVTSHVGSMDQLAGRSMPMASVLFENVAICGNSSEHT